MKVVVEVWRSSIRLLMTNSPRLNDNGNMGAKIHFLKVWEESERNLQIRKHLG
ncbi:unnamed protein product [Brassica oleracea]